MATTKADNKQMLQEAERMLSIIEDDEKADEGPSLSQAVDHGAPAGSLARIGIGTRRLSHLKDYRIEMQHIYKALAYSLITDKQASRLIWILENLRRAKIDEKKLEIIQGGGIGMDAPFSGLTIVGSGKAQPLPYSPKKTE